MWLYSRSIESSQSDENIEMGRFLHAINYAKHIKEVSYANVKFDVVEQKNGILIITENKKSLHFEIAAKFQLGYYLYLLKQSNITAIGYLSCPSEKRKLRVDLNDDFIAEIERQASEIKQIIDMDYPPKLYKNKYCTKCAYREYCYA